MKYGVVDFPQKGKGLIALEDCEENETLFSEEPICSAQMAWGRKLNYKEILASFKTLGKIRKFLKIFFDEFIVYLNARKSVAQGV